MIVKSYVINLKRRPDRLKKFREGYDNHMPIGVSLKVVEAVDGTDTEYMSTVPESLLELVSGSNDYGNKTTIHATVFSHLKVWKDIAEGEEAYGFIFEDDAIFARSRELTTQTILTAMGKYPWKSSILYFGVGDCLPIHTNAPTESMLRAQEHAHVVSDLGGLGVPNFKSAYVFDWLGGFSYILSKEAAQMLLSLAQKDPITCAVDSWMKKQSISKMIDVFLTVPLLTYTSLQDSTTQGVENNEVT